MEDVRVDEIEEQTTSMDELIEAEMAMEMEKSSISKNFIRSNIRKNHFKKIRFPFICLILLIVIGFFFPLKDYMFPTKISPYRDLSATKDTVSSCIEVSLKELYFTGYTSSIFSRANGYYYYTIHEGRCLIILLSPATCEEGKPIIDKITIKAVIEEPSRSYEQLLFNLSSDLNWTKDGLLTQMEGVYLNEVALSGAGTKILFGLYFIALIYTFLYCFFCALFGIFPMISPAVLSLARFGNPFRILRQAENELATLPQLATEDMFITENFFIEVSQEGIAIVPISDIIWIYKHSTLHKFLWYHFEISYTLHIRGTKHFYVKCPKNIKSDIDGVIDYLSEANHDILVGLNEENRVKAQEVADGKLFHLGGLLKIFTARSN